MHEELRSTGHPLTASLGQCQSLQKTGAGRSLPTQPEKESRYPVLILFGEQPQQTLLDAVAAH